MPSYPGGIWTPLAPGALESTVPTHSTIHNAVNAEIVAIEGELGVNPKGTYATLAARLSGTRTVCRIGASGASVTTSGTARVVPASDTFPDQGVTGKLLLAATLTFTGGTAGDQFVAVFNVAGADQQPAYFSVPTAALGTVTLTAAVSMAAGAAKAVSLQVSRSFGTGVITINSSSLTTLSSTFIPD